MSTVLLGSVVLDCCDPGALAGFYGNVLGWALEDDGSGSEWGTLVNPAGGTDISFQRDPEYRPSTRPSRERQQMLHLDRGSV